MAYAKINIVTPVARISYPHLFKAVRNELITDREVYEYKTVLLIKKDDPELDNLKKAFKSVIDEQWGTKIPKFVNQEFLQDGDLKEQEAYQGCFFFNAKNQTKPDCIDLQTQQPILSEAQMYAGCFVRGDITFTAYEVKNKNGALVNAGVSIYLNNVLKVADGDRLDGKRSAKSAFADFLADGVSVEELSEDDASDLLG